jgi:ABC-2 type transport system ATP-binding protein
MAGKAIEIEGLRKVYPGQGGEPAKVALEGLDLAIPEGCIFGLLGPNGAGKSTTINILAGLTVKTAGRVRIWGFDLDVNPRQARAAIGVVPQELNIDPFFTPRAALEVQAGLYGVPRRHRRTDEILARVGLADKAGAYARLLSGGMKRRLLIAKALVHNPPVLVLDEPTAGVDIELRQMLWAYVRELNAAGTTIILTTHYLEEAEAMCDRIAIINNGKLVAEQPTAELVGRIDRKALVVLPAAPVPALPAAPEGVELSRRADGALVFAYHRSRTTPEVIFDLLRREGIAIRDVAVEEPHLEDVFVALTTSRPAA